MEQSTVSVVIIPVSTAQEPAPTVPVVILQAHSDWIRVHPISVHVSLDTSMMAIMLYVRSVIPHVRNVHHTMYVQPVI